MTPFLRLSLVLAWACALSLAGFDLCAQEAPWIKLEAGGEFRVRDNSTAVDPAAKKGGDTTVSVMIPVSLSGVTDSDVSVALAYARLGKEFAGRYAQAFAVGEKLVRRGDGTIALIDLTMDTAKADEQGTYELVIEARTSKPQIKTPVIALNVKIEHPPAVLRPLGTVQIERVTSPFSETEVLPSVINLEETSGLTRVTQAKLQPVRFPAVGQTPVVGTITLEQDPPPIAPRGNVAAKLKVGGDFPLGSVEGTADLTAKQLAQPLAVTFKVTTRRTLWFILFLVVAGLICGWLMRVALRRTVEISQARLGVLDLLERLRTETGKYPDQDLRATIEAISNELQLVVDSKDDKALTAQAASAQKKLDDALADFKKRAADVAQEIAKWGAAVETPWSLPDALGATRATAASGLQQARKELAASNVIGAANAVHAVVDELRKTLEEQVDKWKAGALRSLELLQPQRLKLDAGIVEKIRVEAQALQSKLGAVSTVSPTTTPEQIGTALQAIYEYRRELRRFNGRVAQWLTDFAQDVDYKLSAVASAQSADLRDASLQRAARLGSGDDPEATLEKFLSTDQDELDKSLNAGLGALIPSSAPNAATIREQITTRHYSEAAGAIAQTLTEIAEKEGRALKKTTAAAAERAELQPGSQTVVYTEGMSFIHQPVIQPSISIPDRIAMVRAQTLKDLFLATMMQTVFVGAGIVAIGYLTYADKFVGTYAELGAIFLWAFGLDVTVDALLGLAKGVKRPQG